MRSTADRELGSAEALLVAVSEPTRGQHNTAGALDALLPAAVLIDLVDGGYVTMGEGRVTRHRGARAEDARSYELSALALGGRLDGTVSEALQGISDGLRPLHETVAADLVAEGWITSASNGLAKMDFGYRFPVPDARFRHAVRTRVQEALETGDVTRGYGRAALLLAAGRFGTRVFSDADTAGMDAVVARTTSPAGARFPDLTAAGALEQLTAALHQPSR